MTERSARFDLPFILPGQAQKEAYHNEALVALDGLVHAAAEGEVATPPADPDVGACWIVASGATGDWAGKAGAIALWTAGGWRFLSVTEGMAIWDKSAGLARIRIADEWSDGTLPVAALTIAGDQVVGPRLSTIADPTGGAIVDTQARAAVAAVIVALKSHGLID